MLETLIYYKNQREIIVTDFWKLSLISGLPNKPR